MPRSKNDIAVILKVRSIQKPGTLGELIAIISKHQGIVDDMSIEFIGALHSVRLLTVSVNSRKHLDQIINAISKGTANEILEIQDIVFERHRGGKIESVSKTAMDNLTDMRYIYTPGVARVCKAIQEDEEKAYEYTNIANSVGIFTNGTRILGLGDIGPVAGMPVMEGKAVIYRKFVGVSAVPILIDTKDPMEFVDIVEKISPTFGGIHLEDIRMPDCFVIEDELIRRLRKPVMHDDQHGTATVVLAAVISALRETNQESKKEVRVAQIGLGAAGLGIAKLLFDFGLDVIGVDLDEQSRKRFEDYGGRCTDLKDAFEQVDIVIATTGVVGLIKPEMIRKDQIILPLTNPIPEIMPEDAINAGASFAADGRSINNALAYPGLFKAALETRAESITSPMKIAVAKVILALADRGELVPSPFHPEVHSDVVQAVIKSTSGVEGDSGLIPKSLSF